MTLPTVVYKPLCNWYKPLNATVSTYYHQLPGHTHQTEEVGLQNWMGIIQA